MIFDKETPNRKLIRLKEYNYSEGGYYFVTICTKDKRNWFGVIKESKSVLYSYSKILEQCLIEIPIHFENVNFDYYVIMPNHIHFITG